MPQIIGRYPWNNLTPVPRPTSRQPPTRDDEGLAPVFVPMFLDPRHRGRVAQLPPPTGRNSHSQARGPMAALPRAFPLALRAPNIR